MPHTLAAQLGQLIYITVLGLSALGGRWVERTASAALVLQILLETIVDPKSGLDPGYGLSIVDGMVLVVFAVLAFRSNRGWTLWATAFQGLAVLTTCARMLDPSLHLWVYMTTAILWGYGVLSALAVGTFQVLIERSRLQSRRRHGLVGALNRR